MTPRMNDERIKEALERRGRLISWMNQIREHMVVPAVVKLAVDDLPDALHDLQDARAENERLQEVHNIMHRIIGIAVIYKCIIKGAIARCGSWSCVGCRARDFTDEVQAALEES